MSEYTAGFKIDVVNRTKEIIEKYEGDYEVTLLINCVSSLINLPVEFNSFKKNGYEFKHHNGFQNTINHSRCAAKLRCLCESITESEEKSDTTLLSLFRNGFAHYDIEVDSIFDVMKQEKVISKIKVNNAEVTFIITPENLKKFALDIAEQYLDSLDNYDC